MYLHILIRFIAKYVCTYKEFDLVTKTSSTQRQKQHRDDKKEIYVCMCVYTYINKNCWYKQAIDGIEQIKYRDRLRWVVSNKYKWYCNKFIAQWGKHLTS